MSQWSQSAILLSLLAVATVGGQVSAKAAAPLVNSATNSTILPGDRGAIAQSPENLCRTVSAREGLAIRERPDPNSARVGGVAFNRQVTLAAGDTGVLGVPGPDGRFWVEITAPVRGYVTKGFPNSQSNLIRCTETTSGTPQPAPPANGSLCRQIEPRVAPRGIAVRADASRFSAYRGGVSAGGRVTLVSNYRLVLDKSGENRNWVEISAPVRGFISAGNLIMCR